MSQNTEMAPVPSLCDLVSTESLQNIPRVRKSGRASPWEDGREGG